MPVLLFRHRHLVIFGKAPRLGTVKSRLAREIGSVAAQACYRAMLRATLERLGGARCWRTWLAVTPDRAALHAREVQVPAGTARIEQGSGDLGQRMLRAFGALPPGPAVLVGSDVPAMSALHIEAAFAALGRRPAVFGPAADGGYWLIGLRRLRPMPALFSGVRWSTATALADTLRNLDTAFELLDARLMDIDDAASLAAYRRGAIGPERYFSTAS